MTKRQTILIIIAVLLLIGALIGGIFLISNLSNPPEPKQPKEEIIKETEEVFLEEDKEYVDPDGYSFKIPANIEISKTKPEMDVGENDEEVEEEIISQVYLQHPDKGGTLSIVVTSYDDTITPTPEVKESKISDVILADQEGYQYKKDGMIVSKIVDIQALITIKTQDDEYWEKVNDNLIESFQFVEPEVPEEATQQAPAGGGGGDIIFEGEEIIE